MVRLKKYFDSIVTHDLALRNEFYNVMQKPSLNKVILNMGLGKRLISDRKEIVRGLLALELITNQKAVVTKAKQSLDKFKIRKGIPLGCKVTLRKNKMYLFLDHLNNSILPNLEEFTTFSKKYTKAVKKNKAKKKSFVKINESYQVSLGFEDFFSFKEIPYDKFDRVMGFNMTFVFKAGTKNDLRKSKKLPNFKFLRFHPSTNLKSVQGFQMNSKNSLNTLLTSIQIPIASI